MNKNPKRRQFLKASAAMIPAAIVGKSTFLYAQEDGEEKILDIFEKRRSVREYLPTQVPAKHLNMILKAAACAPTAGNQQPWKFLVIQSKETIGKMRLACIERSVARFQKNEHSAEEIEQNKVRTTEYYDKCFSAPTYIVVLTDGKSKYPTYNHWDGPLAAGYLILAARALGYGTVHYTDSIPDEVTKSVLSIPDRYTRVTITPLGIPKEWPDTPAKKSMDEMVNYESL